MSETRSREAMKIIIYAPHVCIVTNLRLDPSCDYRSKQYAQAVHKAIPRSTLIQSRTLRAECDNNRWWCRMITPSRRRLRQVMQGRFRVYEIHTFRHGSVWRTGGPSFNPEIVLLRVGSDTLIDKVYAALKRFFDVAILQGSDVNDVQTEVQERNGEGVLIELRQDLTIDRVMQIGRVLKKLNA